MLEQERDALLWIRAALLHRSFGEGAGRFDVLRFVQQQQRLQRRVGALAADRSTLRAKARRVMVIIGGGDVRFQKMYMLRRCTLSCP